MNRNDWKSGLLALISLLAVVGTGCGDDEPTQMLECGEGTELRDGTCVVQEHDCGDGEIVGPAGTCMEPGTFCEEDSTSYDADLGECVSDAGVVCGEGTVEEEGRCVAESEQLECGPGTVLADGTCQLADEVCGTSTELNDGQCEVSEDACAQGAEYDVETGECVYITDLECGTETVERDGECVPFYTQADELAEQADIDFEDGEPIEPTDDSSFVFTGQLDNQLSQTFDLNAEEGEWLEITIYSRGLPSPGFELVGPAGEWRRAVGPAMESAPGRTVLIPASSTYELTVETSMTGGDASEEIGDSSWKYVGEVEVVDAPDPTAWDLETGALEGDLAETTQNLVELDVTETDEVFLTSAHLDEDVEGPTVERWDGDSFGGRWDLVPGQRIELDVESVDEVQLHFDGAEFVGPRTEFEISGQLTETVPSNGFYFDQLSAEAGRTLTISHRSDQGDSVGVRIFRDDEYQGGFEEVQAENKGSYDTDETERQYFHVPEDGDYLIEFQNTNDHELTSFVSTSGVEDHPKFEVDEEGVSEFDVELGGTDLEYGQWRVIFIEAPDTALLSGSTDQDSGYSEPDVSLYDVEGQQVAHESSGSGGSTEFDFAVAEGGLYMLAIQPSSSFGIDNPQIEMTGEVVDYVSPGESHEITFDAAGFDILSGNVSVYDGPSPTVRLWNPDQFLLFEHTDVDDQNLMEIIPGPGEYALEFKNAGSDPMLGLETDVHVTTPYDILDVESDFSESYELEGLDEGERDMLLFRPETDFLFDFTAMFGEGETGTVRLWDVENREVILERQSDQRIDIESEGIGEGTYVLEFVADSAIESYETIFTGSNIEFVDQVRNHQPPLEISPGGTFESSALAIEECRQIVDVSLATNFDSVPTSSDVSVHLYAPDLDQSIAVRDGSYGSHDTVYPDEDDPDESFQSLIGTDGTGVWSIDVENNHDSSAAALSEWSLHLTCVN